MTYASLCALRVGPRLTKVIDLLLGFLQDFYRKGLAPRSLFERAPKPLGRSQRFSDFAYCDRSRTGGDHMLVQRDGAVKGSARGALLLITRQGIDYISEGIDGGKNFVDHRASMLIPLQGDVAQPTDRLRSGRNLVLVAPSVDGQNFLFGHHDGDALVLRTGFYRLFHRLGYPLAQVAQVFLTDSVPQFKVAQLAQVVPVDERSKMADRRDKRMVLMVSDREIEAINSYRWKNHIGSGAQAVRTLIEAGLRALEAEWPSAPTPGQS
jgi:hypothetical protein